MFSTNLNEKKGTFSLLLTNPHNYYAGELYAEIIVKNSLGEVRYEKKDRGQGCY